MVQYEDNDSRLIPATLQHRAGPIPDDDKEAIKAKLLEIMGQTQNVQVSCEAAGITRATYNNWKRSGYITKEDLDDSIERYCDFLRGEVQKRFLRGDRRPLLQNGRMVRDEKNQPIWVDHPDSKLLWEVAKHWLPELRDDVKNQPLITVSGIPAQYLLQFDSRELLPHEFEAIKQIVLDIEARKAGVIIVDAG